MEEQTVGNKSGAKYDTVCICCGNGCSLQLFAHRNKCGYVTGFVFACFQCNKKMEGRKIEMKDGD